MLDLFPEGFEERELSDTIELAAYTDTAGERRMRQAFTDVVVEEIEAGWEERWREFHRSVRIGPLWIGPPWEDAPADVLAVVIEPAQAFGTGAHATTRLCIELLTELPRGGLLDVGCGSGVLAVAAAKLGDGPVQAVDVDLLAVEATVANARENGVDVIVNELDALASELPSADTTVANLTLDAVRALAPRVESTHLVTSGYLAGDHPDLRGFERLRRDELDGWAADVWTPLPK